MKKFLIALLMVFVLLTTSACRGTNDDDDKDDNNDDPIVDEEEAPTLSGVSNTTVAWGSSFDALEGVSATAYDGTDLTDDINVEGEVDTMRSQSYSITYTVEDSENQTTTITRTIEVDFPTFADFIQVAENEDISELHEADTNLDMSESGNSDTDPSPHWTTWGSGGSYTMEDGELSIETSMSYYQVANNGHVF
ncbi:MAG: immunoglobulin-like domain-containing protein, partial [Bacillota bacterium]